VWECKAAERRGVSARRLRESFRGFEEARSGLTGRLDAEARCGFAAALCAGFTAACVDLCGRAKAAGAWKLEAAMAARSASFWAIARICENRRGVPEQL
jgi:hypothetical protein